MASDASVVDVDEAQALFASLPRAMQWPTLSPAYVTADTARDASLRPLFLVSRRGDGLLMHMVVESPIEHHDAVDWQSAYGYGGPIAHGLDDQGLAQAWQELDNIARQRKVVAEFIRFHPALENHRWYPGIVREDRQVVRVGLRTQDLMSSYVGRTRTAIRKAERDGLLPEWQSRAQARERFPEFYRQCMREIGATDFYLFSDAYFEHLLRLPGARVLAIQDGDRLLSMGVFLFGPDQAEYHLSGTSSDARQSGATNLLLHVAAQSAKEAGCTSLYLGGGTTSSQQDPLLKFKKSFADPDLTFRIGGRVHDPAVYETLKAEHPDKAASGRILFYRSQ